MKNKIVYSLYAIAMLFMLACSNDNDWTEPETQEGHITFTLQGLSKAATYADPQASDAEKTLSTLDIYMFKDETNKAGKLEKVFSFGGSNDPFGGTGGSLTATLDLTSVTGSKRFYFIGNSSGKVSGLDNVILGITTEAMFVESLTEVETALLTTPLLFSCIKSIDLDGTITDNDKKIALERRVARFDVSNVSADTNFEIKKILVTNAKQQGYVFGEATGGATIDVTDQLPEIDYESVQDANLGETTSIFYLNPTNLGDGNTSISFIGKFLNDPIDKIYTIDPSPAVSIEPNKRYMLKATKVDENKIEFGINREEWANDGEHTAKPKGDQVVFSPITMSGGTGITVTGNSYDITNATTTATLYLTVTSNHEAATTARLTYINGSETDFPGFEVNTPTPVRTYAAGYIQEYRIQVPIQSTKKGIELKIEIINNVDPSQRVEYIIRNAYYPGTALKPVTFEGVTWAPVNVGATTVSEPGLYFQWGRNEGFTRTPEVYDKMGPVNKDVAEGEAKGKYIRAHEEPWSWISPVDMTLWTGANAQGPCPNGWKIPADDDFKKIRTAAGTPESANPDVTYLRGAKVKADFANKCITVLGSDGTLVFPTTSCIMQQEGAFRNDIINSHGYYWTTTPYVQVDNRFWYFLFYLHPSDNKYGYVHNNSGTVLSLGMPVRCIKNN